MDFDPNSTFGLSLRNEETSSSGSSLSDQYLQLRHLLHDGAELSAAIAKLGGPKLSAVIGSETNVTLRRRFLQSAADVVTPGVLLLLVHATASAYGQTLSRPFGSLLHKLAREARELPEAIRPQADRSFRDLFKHIVEAWSVGSLDTGSSSFESLFQEPHDGEETSSAGTAAPEPERVIQLAFESGAMGNVVWTAIAHMGDSAGVRRLLDMIKAAPPESRAANAVGQQFANPTRLAMLLHEEPVDFGAVDALLPHMGDAGVTVLLEAIAEAKSRETRRSLLDRIVKFGPNICPTVIDRLNKDARWFVQRNMLTILRELRCPVAQVPIERFLSHTDPRVRREAMQLQFSDPLQRDRALLNALRETDSQIVKVALQASRTGLPEAGVPILTRRIVENDFPPEFRPAALQLIGRSNSVLALEALLRFAMAGTTLLGKPKLAQKSPEMLIALSGLARAWPHDRRAAPLLAAARESKDREIASAATPTSRGTPLPETKDVLDDLG